MDSFNHQGIQVANRNITHLAYTDDIVLMTHTKENLKMLMMTMESIANKFGLKVNPTKTKYMVVGTASLPDTPRNPGINCG